MKVIRYIDLFAGVGGFRLGLDSIRNKDVRYEAVWSNQWEPSTSKQHAAEIYVKKFGAEDFSNEDIAQVIAEKFDSIPDHDLLTGGFPCQDYSVARTLSHAKGLVGEKGVLWWSIHAILKGRGKKAPRYLMLENVDRLLKSPAGQRGRDFAIMLASLSDLGYAVEWRVINAADYGFPQRRRRAYILGYRSGTPMYRRIASAKDKYAIIHSKGAISDAFPIVKESDGLKTFKISGSLSKISDSFSLDRPHTSPFRGAGVMFERNVWTTDFLPYYIGKRMNLGDILLEEKDIPEEYFIKPKDMPRWKYLKGAKKEPRRTKDGHIYTYNEGPMVFPDSLDRPSRTVVTGEGGSTPSRFKHVVKTPSGRLRRLVPIELERLDMFPDNHTYGVSDNRRAFFMGNALVVGVIRKLGNSLISKI